MISVKNLEKNMVKKLELESLAKVLDIQCTESV